MSRRYIVEYEGTPIAVVTIEQPSAFLSLRTHPVGPKRLGVTQGGTEQFLAPITPVDDMVPATHYVNPIEGEHIESKPVTGLRREKIPGFGNHKVSLVRHVGHPDTTSQVVLEIEAEKYWWRNTIFEARWKGQRLIHGSEPDAVHSPLHYVHIFDGVDMCSKGIEFDDGGLMLG